MSRSVMRLLRGHRPAVPVLAFSPDSRTLVAGGAVLSVWDLHAPGAPPPTVKLPPEPPGRYRIRRPPTLLREVRFAGPRLVAGLGAARWWLFDLPGGRRVELDGADPERAGILSACGAMLKLARSQAALEWWPTEVATFAVGRAGLGHPSATPCEWAPPAELIDFLPDGESYLAYRPWGEGGKVVLHESATDDALMALDAPPGPSPGGHLRGTPWRFSPGGELAYAAASRHWLAYDLDAGGLPVAISALPDGAHPRGLAVHPGGRVVATVETADAVTIRRAETLEVARRYDFGVPDLTAVAFAPDGLLAAVGTGAGRVFVFDVDD